MKHVQLKLFNVPDDRIFSVVEKFEKEINEFIKEKDIIDIHRINDKLLMVQWKDTY